MGDSAGGEGEVSVARQILPQRGRGTSEAGGGAHSCIRTLTHNRTCPSTILRMVPLLLRNAFGSPVPGRNWQ